LQHFLKTLAQTSEELILYSLFVGQSERELYNNPHRSGSDNTHLIYCVKNEYYSYEFDNFSNMFVATSPSLPTKIDSYAIKKDTLKYTTEDYDNYHPKQSVELYPIDNKRAFTSRKETNWVLNDTIQLIDISYLADRFFVPETQIGHKYFYEILELYIQDVLPKRIDTYLEHYLDLYYENVVEENNQELLLVNKVFIDELTNDNYKGEEKFKRAFSSIKMFKPLIYCLLPSEIGRDLKNNQYEQIYYLPNTEEWMATGGRVNFHKTIIAQSNIRDTVFYHEIDNVQSLYKHINKEGRSIYILNSTEEMVNVYDFIERSHYFNANEISDFKNLCSFFESLVFISCGDSLWKYYEPGINWWNLESYNENLNKYI